MRHAVFERKNAKTFFDAKHLNGEYWKRFWTQNAKTEICAHEPTPRYKYDALTTSSRPVVDAVIPRETRGGWSRSVRRRHRHIAAAKIKNTITHIVPTAPLSVCRRRRRHLSTEIRRGLLTRVCFSGSTTPPARSVWNVNARVTYAKICRVPVAYIAGTAKSFFHSFFFFFFEFWRCVYFWFFLARERALSLKTASATADGWPRRQRPTGRQHLAPNKIPTPVSGLWLLSHGSKRAQTVLPKCVVM